MKTRSIRSKTTANRYCANSPMCNHLSARHHAAGIPLFAEPHILALGHEVVVNYVFPLIGILTERRPDIVKQVPILMVGTGAHPLMRHIHQVTDIPLVHDFLLSCQAAVRGPNPLLERQAPPVSGEPL